MGGKTERFEDLIVWQRARQLTREVYKVTNREKFARDFGLASQIQRAGVSIMSNIAEGFERSNPGDYLRFLLIAKASCGEVRSQLYVAWDVQYLSEVEFQQLSGRAVEISRLISGLAASVRKNRNQPN